jgi:3-oxoacyl-[acyl-carrier-protein] synthase III
VSADLVRRVGITGTGAYLPERVVTNAELELRVDTTDEWIFSRTGIRERRIAAEGECTSQMAAEAAARALANAGLEAGQVQLLIVATITPDMMFPSTACFVQDRIGARGAFCFDLGAACSGFLYAMETARQFIAAGRVENALVVGAEKLSCFTDWDDRSTCVLFGDGAGAVVLQPREERGGILASTMGSDGALAHLLNIPGGGSVHPPSAQSLADKRHYLKMEGREVFKHAVRCMCDASLRVLAQCGVGIEDVACIIPHQANMRIMTAIADRIGAPIERFYLNLDRYGNMSAASAVVALDEAVRGGRIRRGDRVLLVVFGGGFTWGAALVEW